MRIVFLFSLCILGNFLSLNAQTNPAITTWLQNTTTTGSYYMSGNSTTIPNNILVNCQLVEYSTNNVFIHTKGIPAYPTGPFQDGNPSQAEDQDAIFKFPLNPTQNTGTSTPTTMGNIGVFINGVALFDYSDGVAWDPSSNSLCGGPGNSPCPGGVTMDWNRDAVLAEMSGFDCSKGHPADGNYHHHQNPSAFDLDLNVISTICNLYDADGLYTIDAMQHSPLIGFAYDGFPVYGAYGYANTDGTGEIVRIKSSYELKTTRGTGSVPSETTWPLGTFREDYEYIDHSGQSDYLDEHNGRFCVTPEYPNGIYCYFATVDENWNSAYPYAVGPTFYGVYQDREVSSVDENTTIYDSALSTIGTDVNTINIKIFPNPSYDLINIQIGGINNQDIEIELIDAQGKLIQKKKINKGQTIGFFDIQTVYSGVYIVKFLANGSSLSRTVIIDK
ncbi:MAG: YHYH protein [Flavobacteriaceae bacterium]|nr:YHYH protein [Flavobacteriaceae bacterium]